MAKSIKVKFRGVTYRKYPQSDRYSTRNYFTDSASPYGSFHRAVWAAGNKVDVIPKGMQVHHKDGNTMNNSLSNLELVHPSDHQKKHKAEKHHRLSDLSQPLHVGRTKWFEENLKRPRTCVRCSAEYRSRSTHARFCTPACRQAGQRERQKAGKAAKGKLTRIVCVSCKEQFFGHYRRITCSHECKKAWNNKQNAPEAKNAKVLALDCL